MKFDKTMTYSDIIDTLLKLKGKEQQQFAKEVTDYAKSLGGHALSNLGYFIGYYGTKEREILHKLLKVNHPIFGDKY